MNVIILIDGREAIPIRAIPFLTDWTALPPQILAASLCQYLEPGVIQDLKSYKLDGIAITLIKPISWVNIEGDLRELEVLLNTKNAPTREWRIQSVLLLPPSAFVWKDEFEDHFAQTFTDINNDSGVSWLANLDDAHHDFGFDYSPLIEPELESSVMEGFVSSVTKSDSGEAADRVEYRRLSEPPVPATPQTEIVEAASSVKTPASGLKIPATGPTFSMPKTAMIEQHKHEWPTIRLDIKDAYRNGLNAAKAGERGWYEAKAMEWARTNGKLTSIDKPAHTLALAMNNMSSLPTSRITR